MEVIDIVGVRAVAWPEPGPPFASARDASDLVGAALSSQAGLVVLPAGGLSPDFLRLASGLAGETLQKFVNYGLKVAIVGDISAAMDASGPLRDFVRESNRGLSVWFLPDRAALEARVAEHPPAA